MHVKQGNIDNLADVETVQAFRLGQPDYETARANDRIDPFPHGKVEGAVASNGYGETSSLVVDLLRSVDGGLPDYILEELFRSLHNDDPGLYDFLGIFDQRLQELSLRVDVESISVAQADARRESERLIARLEQLLGRQARPDMLALIPAMLARSRNLEVLGRIVEWWTGHKVAFRANFETFRVLDPRALTRIGAHRGRNALLGHGAMLGRLGKTPQGRIDIELECEDEQSLEALSRDPDLLEGLRLILDGFFRDPTPIQVFALVKRGAVPSPRLKGRGIVGTRLGAYNCLTPELNPDFKTLMKLEL